MYTCQPSEVITQNYIVLCIYTCSPYTHTDIQECSTEMEINIQSLTPLDNDIVLYTLPVVRGFETPVEICIDGQYESVCDIGWDLADALAVCREIYHNASKKPFYRLAPSFCTTIIPIVVVPIIKSCRATVWLGSTHFEICIENF